MENYTLPFAKRMMLFLCITAICLIFGSVLVAVITHNEITAPRIRIATTLQDLVMFVLPPLATALLITRRPADYLMISRYPRALPTALVILAAVTTIPAMNFVIDWNSNLTLPESMSAVEDSMRQAETRAQEMIETLIGGPGIGSLIITILIVGILAGFSEELFFRGGLQRLMISGKVNPHLAIWITAIIFSAVHMQFFGFFPRMILGAFFGYLAWWSKSLWLPIIAHVFNNILAGTALWLGETGNEVNKIGTYDGPAPHATPILVIGSVILTAIVIRMIYTSCTRPASAIENK